MTDVGDLLDERVMTIGALTFLGFKFAPDDSQAYEWSDFLWVNTWLLTPDDCTPDMSEEARYRRSRLCGVWSRTCAEQFFRESGLSTGPLARYGEEGRAFGAIPSELLSVKLCGPGGERDITYGDANLRPNDRSLDVYLTAPSSGPLELRAFWHCKGHRSDPDVLLIGSGTCGFLRIPLARHRRAAILSGEPYSLHLEVSGLPGGFFQDSRMGRRIIPFYR